MSPPLKKIAAAYRRHALGYAAASWKGDSNGADRHHRRLIEALLQIRARGAVGDSELLRLLDDEEVCVRAWAASHTLKVDEARSLRVLEGAADDPRLSGFDARMVLKEWREERVE